MKTIKYHVLLPTEEAHHSFHETKGAAGYAQRIHPKLVEKIYELVSEGITDTQEVKQALKHYPLHVLSYFWKRLDHWQLFSEETPCQGS